MSSARNLVVVRAGDSSTHPSYSVGREGFDVLVQYYDKTPGRFRETCDIYLHDTTNGPRAMQAVHGILSSRPELIEQYDHFWFPDDDIQASPETVSAMFEVHNALGLALSQPSLTQDSYFGFHALLHHPGFSARYATFVEVMAPVFRRDALKECLPTFAQSVSGYGIDWGWQTILAQNAQRSAILDCIQVRHTRRLKAGSFYDGLTQDPHREGKRITAQFGVPYGQPILTDFALDDEFRPVPHRDIHARVLLAAPQPTAQDVAHWDGHMRDTHRANVMTTHRLHAAEVRRTRASSVLQELEDLRTRRMLSEVASGLGADVHVSREDTTALTRQSWGEAAVHRTLEQMPSTTSRAALASAAGAPGVLQDEVGELLRKDLLGHSARGRILAARVRARLDDHEPLRIGVYHVDVDLIDLLALAARTPWMRVVVHVPTHLDAGQVAGTIEHRTLERGVELGSVEVEVTSTDLEPQADRSLDAALQSDAGRWMADQPIRLSMPEVIGLAQHVTEQLPLTAAASAGSSLNTPCCTTKDEVL